MGIQWRLACFVLHGWATTHNSCETKTLRGLVYIRYKTTGVSTNYAPLRIDLDSPHACKIDDQPTITHSESSGAMPATTHRDGQIVASAKIESPFHVSRANAANYYSRMPIVGMIVDLTRLIVIRSVRRNHMT
jgi:hypothetical protein